MYEWLLRRLIRQGQNDGIFVPDYLKVKIYKPNYNISDISEEEIINTSVDIENDPYFIDFVNNLFENVIYSLRTQNWVEFKSTIRLMLPWLKIYDNDNYRKWMLQC